MDINIPSGTYVVAVSGGVDSMVLLDLLAKRVSTDNIRLVVAHFDHGIRVDSSLDRELVQMSANEKGLQFVYEIGNLGPSTSEAVAREARYRFLNKVVAAANAKSIITAHHQDDVLETAVLNLLRGTNRRGLTSLRSTQGVLRPLLKYPKAELKQYAKDNQIVWREDSTNSDDTYRRNYVRHNLIDRLDAPTRAKLVDIVTKATENNDQLDGELDDYIGQESKNELNRSEFVKLPHDVAREVMAAWLRANGIREFDKKMIERLVIAAKTFAPGAKSNVTGDISVHVGLKNLALR